MRTTMAAAMLLAACGTTACGFHLRGEVELGARMKTPFIEATDRRTPFYGQLEDALEAAGAEVTRSSEAASATVHIHRDETGRNILTISARNTPQEYEVFYTVEYSVSAEGAELLPRQRLTLSRDYAYDEKALLAKQREESDIREALARDLAALVARRLAAL